MTRFDARGRVASALLLVLVFGLYASFLDYAPPGLRHDEVFFGLHAQAIAKSARDLYGRFLPLYFLIRVNGLDLWFHPALVYATAPWLLVLPGAAAGLWVSSPQRSQQLRDHGDGGLLRRGLAHAVTGIAMLRSLLARPRQHGLGLVGVSLYWFGDIVCLWAALTAFGASLSVPALIVGYATGYALTRRSLPAGGAGLVEVLMTFALTWVGLPFVPSLLGVIVYRFFNFWLPIVPALATEVCWAGRDPDGRPSSTVTRLGFRRRRKIGPLSN